MVEGITRSKPKIVHRIALLSCPRGYSPAVHNDGHRKHILEKRPHGCPHRGCGHRDPDLSSPAGILSHLHSRAEVGRSLDGHRLDSLLLRHRFCYI